MQNEQVVNCLQRVESAQTNGMELGSEWPPLCQILHRKKPAVKKKKKNLTRVLVYLHFCLGGGEVSLCLRVTQPEKIVGSLNLSE